MRFRTILIAGIALLNLSIVFPISAGQQSQWISEGENLNIGKSKETGVAATPHALAPSLTMKGNIPYVAWTEIDSAGISHVYAKQKEGNEWALVGRFLNLSPIRHAANPVLTVSGNNLYAAWSEKDQKNISQIFVRQWNGTEWVRQGSSLNVNPDHRAINPVISGNGTSLYAAWLETDSSLNACLYAKQWDGSAWKSIGNILNISPEKHALTPAITAGKDGLYLAWSEYDEHDIAQLYTGYWNGEKWEYIGKSLNLNPVKNALSPSISLAGNTLFVSWMEYNADGVSQVYVKRWNGKEWSRLGESLNIDVSSHATSPSLAIKDDVPYVAWIETGENGVSAIHVKHYHRSSWIYDGTSAASEDNRGVTAPSVESNDNGVYIAYSELDSSNIYQLYVKRLIGKWDSAAMSPSVKQKEPADPTKGKFSNTFFTRIPLDLSKMPPPPVAVKVIPKTGMGEIDWMKGIRDGLFKPFDSTDPNALPYTPLYNMDMSLSIKKDFGIPDARFPHSSHTMWLDCKNCHPTIFIPKRGGNPITMHRVLEGEYCGRCHGVVAFRLYDCFRCHAQPAK
ncbi:MAG: hypothetical protein HZA08_10915 [Nitrospirae bacterium]|nr:hypothetical protein [Nitrospirota bacterium]